ncbi:mitochondrial carnitine/acylcarnitine carrier protein-like [Zophobas morio]|uniref:mitochondrial carnitine/acylcarnitine carrier protein-like n=1 Tax=Zophobas morio TaxID=2755281 RepID=UPI003082EEB7
MEEQNLSQKPIQSFVAGGFGGISLVVTGHPLDTIKVRIQTMEVKSGSTPPYTGFVDCFQKVIKREGIKGLFKGMAAPVGVITPVYSLCFLGYSLGQQLFCEQGTYKHLNDIENVVRIGLAGAFTSLFTSPVLAPGERIKCILQIQSSAKDNMKFKGPVGCGKALFTEGGFRSLARGFCATLTRDCVGSAFYFSTYEYLKNFFTPANGNGPTAIGTLIAGGFAGIMYWITVLPIDTLKSKLQIAPLTKYPNGMRSVFVEMIRTDGPLALYRGLIPVVLRAFPANAACFFGYETAVKALNFIGVDY